MKHGGEVWANGEPESWMDFSANLRPEGTPPWVMTVMKEALGRTRYYPDCSMNSARKGLAAYAGVPAEHILPTAGGASAIDLALSISRGNVYVQPVTFGEYAERACVHGRHISVWNGACSKGDTVVICNPNNPSGEALSRKEILSAFETVHACGAELVVDEAFIDYCLENSVRADVQAGLVVVGSLTKVLCIPGVRLGYICAASDVIQRLARRMLPWSVSTLAQAVAAKLPEHIETIRQDVMINAVRREKLRIGLEGLGASVCPSAASFLLADFGRDMRHAAEMLRERHILVRTCSSFGLPDSVWRLAVKTEEENMRLLECLKEVLHAR